MQGILNETDPLYPVFFLSPPPEGQTFDQHKADEQLDITIVKLIRDDILQHANVLPKEFIDRLMKILNRGSIHSAASGTFDGKCH